MGRRRGPARSRVVLVRLNGYCSTHFLRALANFLEDTGVDFSTASYTDGWITPEKIITPLEELGLFENRIPKAAVLESLEK